MRTKIVMISGGLLPLPAVKGGGVETLCTSIIDENEKEGKYEFIVFSCEGAELAQSKYKYVRFINIRRSHVIDKFIYRLNKLYRIINQKFHLFPEIQFIDSYDLKVCHLLRNIQCNLILVENRWTIIPWIKKKKGVRLIYHVHYDDVNENISQYDKNKFKRVFDNIDATISVSNFLDKRINKVIDKQIEGYVVKNCIDYVNFSKDIPYKSIIKLKQKYKIPANIPVVMYAGRITEEKGVLELIKAFNKIVYPSCLVIVGGVFYSSNESNSYLESVKEEAKSNNRIFFTGYIKQEDMPIMWALSDIAVVPTLFVEEAAGLVVIEAMAASKPVVISDSGAMQEYVTSKCGFVVKRDANFITELQNKLEMVLQNEPLRIKMGNEGKKVASLYNRQSYFSSISTAIDEIMQTDT